MARLGDVFEIQITGEWGNECTENETGTKVLRTTNFTPEGRINYDDVVVRSINESKVEKKRLHCGDIILEKSGGTEKTPVGRVVFCDESIEESIYLCNNFTQAMRVNQTIAIPRYVFYFMWNLHCSGRTDLLQNKTTGIRNLQVKSYLNEECPLPTLDEQRKIAAVLDKVSNLIAKRRQQLDKLDELAKARFVEMFGEPVHNSMNFPTIQGKDIFKLTNGKFVPESKRFESGIPSYGGNGISWYTDTPLLQNDTIVIGRVGYQSGNVHFAQGPLWITDNAMYVSAFDADKFNLYFLCALMEHIDFTRFQDAGDLKKITQKPFMSMNYIMPNLSSQREYVDFTQMIAKQKLTIQRSSDKLEILKKTLMQQCFGQVKHYVGNKKS